MPHFNLYSSEKARKRRKLLAIIGSANLQLGKKYA